MAVKQLFLPANRAFNSNGLAVPGAVAKLYLSGGTTPAAFYADDALATSLGSSITANGQGRFDMAYQAKGGAVIHKVQFATGQGRGEHGGWAVTRTGRRRFPGVQAPGRSGPGDEED